LVLVLSAILARRRCRCLSNQRVERKRWRARLLRAKFIQKSQKSRTGPAFFEKIKRTSEKNIFLEHVIMNKEERSANGS
jgi:hypothetical protein